MDVSAVSNAELYSVRQALTMSMMQKAITGSDAEVMQLLDGLEQANVGLEQAVASVVGQNFDMSV